MNETDRIKAAYARRDAAGKSELYSHYNPAALYMAQQRERELLGLLRSNGIKDISNLKLLDVGCGNGTMLREFIKYGARPEGCAGVDLLSDRIAKAKELSPNMDFKVSNAASLPFGNEVFDLVICFTVFSSILDYEMKVEVSSEMLRVLHPNGIVLWYDYHVNNPQNPDVRGITKKEINGLFPDCDIRFKRITLAPPIARAIAPLSVIFCQLFEKIPLLCTHYFGAIKKRTL